MLCNDKLGFTLLRLLDFPGHQSVVSLKLEMRTTKSHAPLLTEHYPLVSIARPTFSTCPSTFVNHVLFLRCMIQGRMYLAMQHRSLSAIYTSGVCTNQVELFESEIIILTIIFAELVSSIYYE